MTASEEDQRKFYSTLSSESYEENFLEIRFKNGLKTCFAYSDLNWFHYDVDDGVVDLEFGGFQVSIEGRGLGDKFFQAIKSKRMAWVKEADSDFQDNSDCEIYIKTILVGVPEGFGGDDNDA